MKMLAPAYLVTGAVAAAVAVALTASAQPPRDAPPAKPRPACFWASRVENFAASDTQNLYLRVGVKDVYHAKLFADCMDLEWVHHMALVTPSSSLICEGANPNASVVVRATGVGRQSCPVTFIEKLTPDQVAALPKLARP
jgi:hypothetical protein